MNAYSQIHLHICLLLQYLKVNWWNLWIEKFGSRFFLKKKKKKEEEDQYHHHIVMKGLILKNYLNVLFTSQ